MNKNYFIGAFFGILAAVCYGTNPLGAVHLYRLGWIPETVILYRMALALP
ncbi:MAG TPA: EamA family transporter, partial [Verrucomicrobia bacterium]|nr:EamA family transporter [Verrucomicrobiota bacterium]